MGTGDTLACLCEEEGQLVTGPLTDSAVRSVSLYIFTVYCIQHFSIHEDRSHVYQGNWVL